MATSRTLCCHLRGHLFHHQFATRLLQWIYPSPSLWTIESDIQGLGDGSTQRVCRRRAPRLASARITVSRSTGDRRSLVAVGGGRNALLHCVAFESGACAERTDVKCTCSAWRR